MKLGTYRLLVDPLYIIVIGDLHIGDDAFTENSLKKLTGYINWVEERDNATIFLLGDIFNVATRGSRTSPHKSKPLEEEVAMAIEIFTPVKDKIIGALDGNHEQRMIDYVGYSPTTTLCREFNCGYYGNSAVIKFQVGKRMDGGKERYKHQYVGYFQHTSGGGSTPGGKINRIDLMRKSFANADFFAGGHNHGLGAFPVVLPMLSNGKIVMLKQYLIDCGGYLDWSNSYAEAMQLPPQKLGSPRIRLDGKEKDLHVDI